MSTELLGLPDSPYLTMEEGARFARFDRCQHPVRAFKQWLTRRAIPVVTTRGKLLVRRDVLVASLERRT